MKDNIKQMLLPYQDEMISLRRSLHQIPEIGLELPQTSAFVKNYLEDLGLKVTEYVDGNGLSAIIEGTRPASSSHKVLGLRSDMDGLPIQEDTQLPFSSTNGNMHACGHDGHTAVLLILTKFLVEHSSLFSGQIKVVFQPGEEFPGGARPMIEEGVLEDPHVTRMLGCHMGHLDSQIPKGCFSYLPGPMMASMDRFSIVVRGKGSHGAYPEKAKDPIIAANQIVAAIQTIKSRNIEATAPVVISVTHVASGMNQNIIPDEALIEGTVRTVDESQRTFVHHRLKQICKGMGIAFEVQCDLDYEYKYPVLINDPEVTEETVQSLEKSFGEEKVILSKKCLMGAEDFAFYAQEVPSCYLFFANPKEIDGRFHGHHHAKFAIEEAYLIDIAAGLLQASLDYMNE